MQLFKGASVREALVSVGIGILFMLIALIVQEIIEGLPDIIILFMHHFSVSYLISSLQGIEIKNALLYSIYIGIAAGGIQELFTYIAVDMRPKNMAFFIGLGFSAVDIIILFTETHSQLVGFVMLLVILNIVSSIIFHTGTATFMKWGRIYGFGKVTYMISALLHAAVDGGLVYVDIYILVNPSRYIISSEIYWIFVMIISVSIFTAGIIKLNNARSDQAEREKTVIY